MRSCSALSIAAGSETAAGSGHQRRDSVAGTDPYRACGGCRLVGTSEAALCGHALAETYSVLTRLPRDLRLAPMDAARLTERFAAPLLLSSRTTEHLPRVLAQFEITGGAVYDALVALAAAEHRAELATRDARAKDTYEKIGVHVVVAA